MGATAVSHDMISMASSERASMSVCFYFPGYAQYNHDARQGRAHLPRPVGAWLLANFATVEEVQGRASRNVDVVPSDQACWVRCQ